MDDLISRKAAISATEWAMSDSPSITREDWNAVVEWLEGVPSVEAIPVEWIERKIARLKEMDNAFASLTASQIRALLNDWRTEQNEG